MSHNFELKTNLQIVSKDLEGNVLYVDNVHNLVVSTGLDLIRNHLLSTMTALAPHHFCLGGGTTAAASTDVTLQSTLYDVTLGDSTIRSGGVTFNGTLYSTDSLGSTFKEIGIFTSSSQMIARALISTIIKSSAQPKNEYFAWSFDFTAST